MSEPEPRYVCEAYKWMGQSFQFCDDCGQPIWAHSHWRTYRSETKRSFNKYLSSARREELYRAFQAGQLP